MLLLVDLPYCLVVSLQGEAETTNFLVKNNKHLFENSTPVLIGLLLIIYAFSRTNPFNSGSNASISRSVNGNPLSRSGSTMFSNAVLIKSLSLLKVDGKQRRNYITFQAVDEPNPRVRRIRYLMILTPEYQKHRS